MIRHVKTYRWPFWGSHPVRSAEKSLFRTDRVLRSSAGARPAWPERAVSDGRCDRRADRPGQDLAERGGQGGPGVAGPGRVAPGDEPVRADQDRTAAGDLPVAQTGAARVVQVAVEVADPHRVEREVRLRGELPGRLAPWLALLAGDEQEPVR